jgi:hypothetical protein
MANERQAQHVAELRGCAHALDEEFNVFEALIARYDVLNLETPNFAAGFFATAQEITAAQHLGPINAWNALKAAAPSELAALRAALRTARS